MMADEMRLHLLACLLLGACTFDTSGLASRDLPRVDHPALDGPAIPSDGLRDGPSVDSVLTGVADRPPADLPDARPVDQLSADKPKPDAKKPDGSPPSCLALFQGAGIPGFLFCSQTATTCVFYFDPASSDNCNNMCAKGGKGCIKSAEDSSNGCDTYADQDCTFNHSDGVCHCKR